MWRFMLGFNDNKLYVAFLVIWDPFILGLQARGGTEYGAIIQSFPFLS